ncbi:hypothetical protein HOP50_10g60230 [Chloropicon primus]|uniref:Uncharacterized protein n=1 Tax=Chloropicon primus TaxID=1764295 RepID=A0A5B8MUN4_9CHLO|nr:hypothetical protein A3770_10p60020 [Chloropicon primus]UPR02696.1 hypothetical protein HOP50_10g60230 [Chloropicon primus]|eukprot:QDZ23484.1 hypothetical protein A3770_10p60020 [Chloropicon primus]
MGPRRTTSQGVPLQDVFLHRELVYQALGFRASGQYSEEGRGVSRRQQDEASSSSSSSSSLDCHKLREELEVVKRHLVASEADRAALLTVLRERYTQRQPGGPVRPQRYEHAGTGSAQEDDEGASYDLLEENLLLRAKVDKWKKVASGRNKCVRRMKSLQNEVRVLHAKNLGHQRSEKMAEKVHQLELQVALLRGAFKSTNDFLAGKENFYIGAPRDARNEAPPPAAAMTGVGAGSFQRKQNTILKDIVSTTSDMEKEVQALMDKWKSSA